MKTFIVYCHPSENSFTKSMCDAFIKGVVDSGNLDSVLCSYPFESKDVIDC